jgi:uncharacterized membrane protein (UPF0127 family)
VDIEYPEEWRAHESRSPGEVMRLVREGRSSAVVFMDVVGDDPLGSLEALREVRTHAGDEVPVGAAFCTVSGLTCIIRPGDAERSMLARSLVAGDRVTVRGRPAGVQFGRFCLIVDSLALGQDREEPPWQVALSWRGVKIAAVDKAAERSLRLPCPHAEGLYEVLGIRLRELQMVDLLVGEHPVTAELADTPVARSYGLQGRDSLEVDHGMLFFYREPARPTFVMKTVAFPISIAFIRLDGTVVAIGHMAPGDRRGCSPPMPVNYVLEMDHGWFEDHGIGTGAKVTFN